MTAVIYNHSACIRLARVDRCTCLALFRLSISDMGWHFGHIKRYQEQASTFDPHNLVTTMAVATAVQQAQHQLSA